MADTPQIPAECPPVSSQEMIAAFSYLEREYHRLVADTATELQQTGERPPESAFVHIIGRRGLAELHPDDPDKVEIMLARMVALVRTIGGGWIHPSLFGAAAIIPMLPSGRFEPARLFEAARRLREWSSQP